MTRERVADIVDVRVAELQSRDVVDIVAATIETIENQRDEALAKAIAYKMRAVAAEVLAEQRLSIIESLGHANTRNQEAAWDEGRRATLGETNPYTP